MSKADEKEKLEKIEFSIRMLHFHNYITDTQFFNMMNKLKKTSKGVGEEWVKYTNGWELMKAIADREIKERNIY